MLHRFPGQTDFDHRVIEQDLAHLARSTFAQAGFAEQYVGLPYEVRSERRPSGGAHR